MEYRGVFTIGQKENFRYNYFVSQKRSLMSCLIVFVLILLLNAFLRYSYGMTQSLVSGLLYSLPMAVGGAALLLLIHLLNMYLRLRGLYRQKKLEPFTQDILMNREGLHAASARGNVDLPWKNIALIRELKRDFLLFITESHVYVLPKEQMKNPAEDTEKIRRILHKYMDAQRLKLKG